MKGVWRAFQGLLLLFWCLLLVLLGAQLAQKNAQMLSLDLIVWQTPSVSLGLLLCLLLLAGFLMGLVALLPVVILQRLQLRRLRRRHADSAVTPGG